MFEMLVGKPAHYVAYNGKHLAAIVIEVEDHEGQIHADLAVFTSLLNAAGQKNYGVQFHQKSSYSEEKTPGSWHWIEEKL